MCAIKAIILAAGYAMRLYPLTKDKPKALLPLGGRTLLDRLLDELITIPELNEIALVSNSRFFRQFCDWAAQAQKRCPNIALRVLDDGTETNETRRGAVGDIVFALEKTGFDDDLLVAASDNFFTFPLMDFVRDFRAHGFDTLLAKRMADPEELKRFAVATLDAERRVRALVEKPAQPESDIAVYALYLYRRDTLKLFRAYLDAGNNPDAPGYFPEWLYQRREVRAYLFEGECYDIGTVDSYRALCERFGG